MAETLLRPLSMVNCSIVYFIGTPLNEILPILRLIFIELEWYDFLLSSPGGLIRVVRHLGDLLGEDQLIAAGVAPPTRHASSELLVMGATRDDLLLQL